MALAAALNASVCEIYTDVDGVYLNWGTPDQQKVGAVTPDELSGLDLPKGSMGPKVDAAWTEASQRAALAETQAFVEHVMAHRVESTYTDRTTEMM